MAGFPRYQRETGTAHLKNQRPSMGRGHPGIGQQNVGYKEKTQSAKRKRNLQGERGEQAMSCARDEEQGGKKEESVITTAEVDGIAAANLAVARTLTL